MESLGRPLSWKEPSHSSNNNDTSSTDQPSAVELNISSSSSSPSPSSPSPPSISQKHTKNEDRSDTETAASSSQGGEQPIESKEEEGRKEGAIDYEVANEDSNSSKEKNASSSSSSSGEDDKNKWTFRKQLQKDQDLLSSHTGLPSTRSIPLSYSHLSVRGSGGDGDVEFAPTVGSMFMPWSGKKDAKKAARLHEAKAAEDRDASSRAKKSGDEEGEKDKASKKNLKKGERYLLHDFNGLVKSGEMMLVVGRPGSGCTTFLKALAGLTEGFAGIDGEIKYGTMSSKKELKPYQGQVIFNSEDDIHFPNLAVGHTLDFALQNNTPAPEARPPKEDGSIPSSDEYDAKFKAELLKIFGLEHTNDTKVGDEYVRGVSGGEKKRVSIAEVLTSRASVQLWDNATRGLDANTALAYAQIMRDLTDVSRNTTVISLYQAGNQIYKLFDKVTVIAEGEIIYYGPRDQAKGYFEDMGFDCLDGANVADFLTGVTVMSERRVREGFESKIPTRIADFASRYRSSEICRKMQEELDHHLADEEGTEKETRALQDVVKREKHKRAIKNQPQTVGFGRQVTNALQREYRQRWGDQYTLWARQLTTLVQSLIVGSLFYSMPLTTSGLFTRGGVCFLSLLFPSLISLAETTAAFEGRAVMAKHKGFSMYRPSAVMLAQTLADLPIFLVQFAVFCLISYFMTGLRQQPGPFFIFYLFVYITTLSTTAFFRFIGSMFGSFQGASKVSGFTFSVLVTYAGFIVSTREMKPWFGWLRWLDPIYYSFEALMSNEFTGQTFECAPNQLVPYGEGYTTGSNQGCAIAGSVAGSTSLSRTTYLSTALALYRSHLWRNFGIVIALWIFFVVLTCIGTERLPGAGSTKAILLYKRGGGGKFIKSANQNGTGPRDEEEGSSTSQTTEEPSGRGEKDKSSKDVHASNSVFTWSKLTYKVGSGDKQLTLLQDVQGWCKPGTLTALMGASGSGKTTLMDCLAQRKDEGELHGEVLVNGQPLPLSFQRTTGFCEQVDVHLPQATVREALEFSAMLRQPRSTPAKERLAYVDTIIELLELHDIEDAIIGVPGAGLGIEQRKRLTIGVELVSKPLLLFLDEPTSGLDGQSSFLIVSFLRRLAAAGQAVVAVIHQPSASLFAEFDDLLLLKKGGRTVYFGKIDKLPEYFEKENVKIPSGVNPAERMIDIVSGELSKGRDWSEVWLKSDNCTEVAKEIERLKAENKDKKSDDPEEGNEFASTTMTQLRLVTQRASTQLWRDTEYISSKFGLHVGSALFNGFTFWMIGNSYADLQARLFTIFQFIFVAPGVIAQVQPKFIANRDIFEAREKKAKLYGWQAFILGEIVAEIPYLLICALLYFAPWYAVVGFSFRPGVAGPVFLEMVLYELLYTGIGQFVAAYAPNATFAALVNPLLIGVLVSFSGVLVPYPQITAFWRYWLYYLNPFNYLMGAMLVFPIWDVEVRCTDQELGRFAPPSGQTCGEYMAPFLSQNPGYIVDDNATDECAYCVYSKGSDYLATLNLSKHIYGWRDICLTFLFVLSSYGLVFLLMKLRSKKTKAAN